ncbi:hypothetical protein [Listeria fleischmannii]|uniref:Uncharacterized protein n=1 Tax=Listeria fleischmannii FSL S10-1203 TaxID=1265822 RepID=W7DRU0_9LIST|nr:hypothetical protein [Listeria fleischmannii]EUJ53033.1 hypothetical protein MCOL2_12297 [Listeria fleischmannii FSL S10-1203]
MKKTQLKIIVFMGLILVYSSFIPNSASAEKTTGKYEIDTISELKSQIKDFKDDGSLLNEEKREEIIENTKPEILEEYTEDLSEKVNEATNELSSSTQLEIDISDNEVYKNHDMKILDDGTIVEVITVDSPVLEKRPLLKATQNYGSRSYSVKTRVYHVLYPDGWTGLVTYYNVGKGGLTATSTSSAGTTSIFPLQISKSTKITDKRAEKVGTDINGQGNYTLTYIGYNGIGLASYDRVIISTIKLTKLTSKNATVSTSYTQR